MMDVSNYNLVVILTIGVVGVFTYIVYRKIIMVPTDQNQNMVPTDQNEALAKERLFELGKKFSAKEDDSFQMLEAQEKDELLAEIIDLLEKIESEKTANLNITLQEKREALADALESLKNVTIEVETMDETTGVMYYKLSTFVDISYQDAIDTALPARPSDRAPLQEKYNWSLFQAFKKSHQKLRETQESWDNLVDVKDELVSEISNIMTDIIKELL